MKPYEVLQEGRKVEILLRDADENLVIPTHVFMNKDDTFLVKASMEPEVFNLTGRTVEVWVGCYDAHYTFESVVAGEKVLKDTLCWELEKPPAMTISDRRSFFRVRTAMPVKWQQVEPEQLEAWESMRPTSIVKLYDLSGSGLSFMYPVEMPVDSWLVFEIPLETESIKIDTMVLGLVVRSDQMDDEYRIAVRFERITKLQQHMIMQHLFSPYRRNIQLSSNF